MSAKNMSCQVDQWLEFAPHLVTGSGLEHACAAANAALALRQKDYVALRTFLVGYSLTLADIAVWAQLQSARRFMPALLRALLLGTILCRTLIYCVRVLHVLDACNAVQCSACLHKGRSAIGRHAFRPLLGRSACQR